jgi:alpha-L-rhamnosidase
VKKDNYHLDAGILGAKAVLNALSDNGYADIAYRIASQETYPSWGWWIKNGATTLYENWNIDAGSDISLNHIMFGEIGAWYYKGLGGIQIDPKQPGFKNVILEPHFVQGLEHFESSHEGPYGNIISSWKKEGGMISYSVTIPANSTAEIRLTEIPGMKVYQDGKLLDAVKPIKRVSGHYNFEIKE